MTRLENRILKLEDLAATGRTEAAAARAEGTEIAQRTRKP
jgi:hypothetical protein